MEREEIERVSRLNSRMVINKVIKVEVMEVRNKERDFLPATAKKRPLEIDKCNI